MVYKTKIKDKYKDTFKSFWWNENGSEEFDVVMNMGTMSLLYCEETGLLLDIFNNKIEKYQEVNPVPKIFVQAKNEEYADRFDLHGDYLISGYTDTSPTMLLLKDVKGGDKEYAMLPSRLIVTEVNYD